MMLRTSDRIDASLARSLVPASFGIALAPRRLTINTTTNNSISVKPLRLGMRSPGNRRSFNAVQCKFGTENRSPARIGFLEVPPHSSLTESSGSDRNPRYARHGRRALARAPRLDSLVGRVDARHGLTGAV